MRCTLALILLLARPASASPITATLTGTHTLAEFDAIGSAVWTADAAEVAFGFHNDQTTLGNVLDTEVFLWTVTERAGIKTYTLTAADLVPRCGAWQFDVGPMFTPGSAGLQIQAPGNCPPIITPPGGPGDTPDATPVPEPGTLGLVGGGIAWGWRRRWRRNA